MKKKLFAAAAVLLTAGFCTGVYADTGIALTIGDQIMYVDGEETEIDTPPVIINDRTFVPVRAVVEALGGYVDWAAETKTALLDSGKCHIELTIDSTEAVLNDTTETLDVAPAIIDGRTMLPLRFIAESFGYETEWDAETKSIYISKQDDTIAEEPVDMGTPHIGEDGRIYYEKDDDIVICDQNDNVLETYSSLNKYEYVYIDKTGRDCLVIYDDDERSLVKAVGTEVKLAYDENGSLQDDNENSYIFSTVGAEAFLCVKNSDGDLIEKYTQKDETHIIYVNENAETLVYVYGKDGSPDSGFILSNGEYVPCEREYKNIYYDEDDRGYGIANGWLVLLGEDGNPSQDIAMSDSYDNYSDDKGNKYRVYRNEDGNSIVEYPDSKKVVLEFEKEETVIDDETGEDGIRAYYTGSDGLIYIDEFGYDYSVYDEDGKKITGLHFEGSQEEYTSNHTVYKLRYGGTNVMMTKPDGGITALTEAAR